MARWLRTNEDIDVVKSAHAFRVTTVVVMVWLCKITELLEKQKEEFIEILHNEGGSTRKKAEFETNKAISFKRMTVGMVRNQVVKHCLQIIPTY